MKVDIVFPDDIKWFIDKFEIYRRVFLYNDLPELKHIEKYIKDIDPKNVLEIGAGLGRGSVFFYKYFGWKNTNFYLLDGDSGDIKYSGIRKDGVDEFYSSKGAAEKFCAANGLKKMQYFNAENNNWLELNVKFNLCYSFLSIGFHWPIKLYLDKIYSMLTNDALLIFGMRSIEFEDFIDEQIESVDLNHYDIIELTLEPKHTRASIMVLRKKYLKL